MKSTPSSEKDSIGFWQLFKVEQPIYQGIVCIMQETTSKFTNLTPAVLEDCMLITQEPLACGSWVNRSHVGGLDVKECCPLYQFAQVHLGFVTNAIGIKTVVDKHFGEDYVEGFLNGYDTPEQYFEAVNCTDRWREGFQDGLSCRLAFKELLR